MRDGWTLERTATLVRMWAEGCSFGTIGEALGVTRNAVCGKVGRLKLPKRLTATAPGEHGAKSRPAKPTKKASRVPSPKRVHFEPPPQLPSARGPPPEAFAPLPHSNPKPWLSRGVFECNWPVAGDGAETWSCCAPVHAGGLCLAHHKLGRVPPKPFRKPTIVIQQHRNFK